MDKKKNFTYKDRDGGNKELLSMLIYRPVANFLLMNVFRFLDISPNLISLLSLSVVVISSWFFAFSTFPYILIGIGCLHLVYAIDMLDGQYARYKGRASKFGKWFDPFVDVIKAALIFVSLSYRAYGVEQNHMVFIWGFIAMTNCFLTFYILNTRHQIIKGPSFEVKLRQNIYVGYEITFYWTITIILLLNRVYLGLIFLGTVGALSWIKTFVTLYRYYNNNRKEVEASND